MARLPQPGSDDGSWGGILNDFLSQAHNADGSLKPVDPAKVSGLATVATSGSYTDLTDKPTAADLGAVTSPTISSMIQITQAAYDALGTKDPNTLYVIVG